MAQQPSTATGRSQRSGWVQNGPLWCLEPQTAPPSTACDRRFEAASPGLVEFIGGSYLAASPQLSYRRLLETLARRGWRLHAWSYVPGFDHQSQANEAWRAFRQARQALQAVVPAVRPAAGASWDDAPGAPSGGYRQDRANAAASHSRGASPPGTAAAGSVAAAAVPVLRLGHSLGCKLHLLAPDGGRGCAGLVALAFNNFSAERSVPLLAEAGQHFGFRSEFSPSPAETLRQVASHYDQPRNLLVRFQQDGLDQSGRLLASLRQRPDDASSLLEWRGDHLTPASAGLRRQLLGDWADDPARQRGIEQLCERIESWWGEAGAEGSGA